MDCIYVWTAFMLRFYPKRFAINAFTQSDTHSHANGEWLPCNVPISMWVPHGQNEEVRPAKTGTSF